MAPHRKRIFLSKNLLEMKVICLIRILPKDRVNRFYVLHCSMLQFMKRTKENTEKELEDEERQATFANEITSAMMSHG